MEKFALINEAKRKVEEAKKNAGLKEDTNTTGKKKKIIGLTCGRKNQFCEMYLKEAAMGAEEFGVETEIIRAHELRIKPCIGCTACTVALSKGELGKCGVKDDDVPWLLENTVLGENALIVAAPVYHLRPNAIFMSIAERMHPTMFNNLDMLKKNKVAGIISVGGGQDGWTSLGLISMNIWVQHHSRVVDQLQVETRERDVDWFSKARELGRNVARAMSLPIEKVEYIGKQSAVSCPVCHCDILQVPQNLPDVACPICWVHGKIAIKDGKMIVDWNKDEISKSRFSEYGVLEHMDIIFRNYALNAKDDKEKIKLRNQKYAEYGKYLRP